MPGAKRSVPRQYASRNICHYPTLGSSTSMTNQLTANALTPKQVNDYEQEGYVKLTGLLVPDELDRLDQAVLRAFADANAADGAAGVQYIYGDIIADPDLAFIVEHPDIVAAVETLLCGPAYLSQYDVKLRRPGYATGEVHYDYKPYRTVGSSLNWLFVMIPLVDDPPHRSGRSRGGGHVDRRYPCA